LPARIVDDKGFVVAKADVGTELSMSFHPTPDYFYSPYSLMNLPPPGTEQSNLDVEAAAAAATNLPMPIYQSTRYFLEVFPSARVFIGEKYPITLAIESKETVPPTMARFRKTITRGPDQAEIALPEPTQFTFALRYTNPGQSTPVRILDTVPAEFEILRLEATAGTAEYFVPGKGKNGASKIVWDLSVDEKEGTLSVEIQTVRSPGRHNGEVIYKPTSCGALRLNDGAIAYEVDPGSGEIVKEEMTDPDTGLVVSEPVVVLGPTNALEVRAVAGNQPCESLVADFGAARAIRQHLKPPAPPEVPYQVGWEALR
jgi:hypothetical protein